MDSLTPTNKACFCVREWHDTTIHRHLSFTEDLSGCHSYKLKEFMLFDISKTSLYWFQIWWKCHEFEQAWHVQYHQYTIELWVILCEGSCEFVKCNLYKIWSSLVVGGAVQVAGIFHLLDKNSHMYTSLLKTQYQYLVPNFIIWLL